MSETVTNFSNGILGLKPENGAWSREQRHVREAID